MGVGVFAGVVFVEFRTYRYCNSLGMVILSKLLDMDKNKRNSKKKRTCIKNKSYFHY